MVIEVGKPLDLCLLFLYYFLLRLNCMAKSYAFPLYFYNFIVSELSYLGYLKCCLELSFTSKHLKGVVNVITSNFLWSIYEHLMNLSLAAENA